MWAAAIVVLLPALAWLQYSWLEQIAMADRDRRERTVRTAASQLAQEFDLELSKAFFALQVDSPTLDQQNGAAYAERYAAWSSSAGNPRLVRDVFVATDVTPSSRPQLRRWNAGTRTFDAVEWPADMQALAERLRSQLEQMRHQPLFRRGDRPPGSLTPDEIGMLIAPIVRVDLDRPRDVDDRREDGAARDEMRRPPDVRLVGFTIVRLDLAVIASEMLPAFVKRHFFDETGYSDFRVAVVSRDDATSIVFESEPNAANVSRDQPDAAAPLMSAHGRPFFMIARSGPSGEAVSRFSQILPELPDAPSADRMVVNILETRRREHGAEVRTRMMGPASEGHWLLIAKHRAGSLEAAVASARTRNFALSSGILLLLSGAIALIVVSARRADRLGRQQMEFVAAVSHELRTPVAVIGAAAGNLADGVIADPTRVRKYGETIQSEARRLGETVERVLQLAGIASGRPVTLATLAPGAVIDDALEACRAEIDAARFAVETDIPAYLPAIRGDRAALRSAIQNLIGNAVKYGRDGRWLGVSVRAIASSPSSQADRASGGGAIEIAIADRGPGIPDDDRAHVFEAFYRGRQAIAQQIQGSGLGLHLVQRIVDAHGGRVSVDCDAAPGCRFIITLPAADAASASEQGERSDVVLPDGAPGRVAFNPGQSH
jgi:signal transduction histidine kinase